MVNIILYSIGLIYITWIFYLAVMNLIRAKNEGIISKPALIMGYPVVAIGLFIDFLLHVTLGSLIFFELPKEWLLTQRLSRLIKTDIGWRGDFALWVCENLLDKFDPKGTHCTKQRLKR